MKTFLLACLLSLGASTALAVVTLPWSTTFDCAETDQDTGGWPNCDGISSHGAWHTSPSNSGEQITSAANHAAGGGGRGQRHWIGDGTNNNSGSLKTSFTNPSTEIYVRWYVRYQSGLDFGNAGSPHKMLYFDDCTGNAGGCYLALSDTTVRLTVAGNNFDNGGTWGFTNWMGQATGDGQWHPVELHVKRNSGTGDGVVEVWFDGVKRLDRTDITFNGSTVGFDGAIIPSNGDFNVVGADVSEDIDDIAIQTTGPIGALGGGGGGGSTGGMDVKRPAKRSFYASKLP